MQLTTHLNFNGNCEAAFNFYAETLGGQITFMMTLGESPMGNKVPSEIKDKIMHATLEVLGVGVLMGGDHPQGKKVLPVGFCVSVQGEGHDGRGENFQKIVRRWANADAIPENVLVAGVRDVHR